MMNLRKLLLVTAPLLLACSLLSGCSTSSGDTVNSVSLRSETPLPVRHGTVLVDGCVLDPWQRSTLAGPGAKKVVQEVILLCLVPRLDGTVGPRDPSALAHLAALSADLRNDGYRVSYGVAFTDETGQRYDGTQTSTFLADPKWRTQFTTSLAPLLASASGVEIDLQGLSNAARQSVTAFVTEISQAVRASKQLGVFVPPSVTEPSDLPGGDAFARADLARQVDRIRVMTLDFTDVGNGPTIDPGWAVDAARLALAEAPAVDIAYPLYGTDFGPRGHRATTWLEAVATAQNEGAEIQRSPTTSPFFRYVANGSEPHALWFDDTESTSNALAAWNYGVLPQDVGIVFYGLGSEEPELFEHLGARLP